MIATIQHKDQDYVIDLANPLDISIPISGAKENITAWYLDHPIIEPVICDDWVGKVSQGASTNFNTITFNPHSHGTHTECVGHITKEFHNINNTLIDCFYKAEVISITPIEKKGDFIITKELLKNKLDNTTPEALVIRTLPNTQNKTKKQYSNTNWPYLTAEAARFICELNISHLLIDLPSVDKEKDEGKLEAHKAFWSYPDAIRFDATITEMIFVADHIKDGSYILNLQTAPFVNDATPSRPILYKIMS